jgi:hypothetical protein
MSSAGDETQSEWDELSEIVSTVEPVAGTATREHAERVRSAHERLMKQFAADETGLDRHDRERVREALLVLGKRAAAIAIAAGERATADRILATLPGLSDDDDERALLRAATLSREEFRALVHGSYLMARGDEPAALKAWTALRESAPDEVLRRAAATALDGPRPLKSLPFLQQWWGFGGGLYGRRDERPDGTYVTNHCWSVLNLPVFPTAAYRVRYHGGGEYRFFHREPLSSRARFARVAAVALLLLGSAAAAIAYYLYDPDRDAKRTFDRALALEQKGTPEEALHALDDALATVDLSRVGDRPSRAGAAIVRLSAQYVPAPFTRDAVDQAHRVTLRYQALPAEARTGVAQEAILGVLEEWIAALDEPDDLEARLVLLRDGLAIAASATFTERIAATRRELATARAKDYPLEALAVLVGEPRDPALLELAGPIVDDLIESPSLLDDAGEDVDAWIAAMPAGDTRRTLVENARALGADTRAESEAEGLTTAQLIELQAKRPWDQRVAVRLAGEELSAGKLDAARERLRALGSPGRMIRDARFLLAQVELASGELEIADELLTRLLASRQHRFLAAREALDKAGAEFDRQLNAKARANALPADLLEKLERASESEQQALFQAWAAEEAEKNGPLVAARTAYYSFGDVVQFSLALGTVKLRRAQALAGAARDAMLADAERAFLSIRTEAEGQPEFHLGLGEVYARLGKTEESDAELQALLDRNDPSLSLEVAGVYRQIGSTERAAAIATEVYGKGGKDYKHAAAVLMSLLASTEDDRALWLGRADPQNAFVRTSLLEIEGSRAMRKGNAADCDDAFTEVAKAHMKGAGNDPVSAYNNAALAHQARFFCKGDLTALAAGEAALERAYRAAPDAPVVVGNLASMLASNADLRVLASRIDISALRPDSADVEVILEALLQGSEREAILAELAADPGARRSAELTAEQQVLSPNRTDGYRRELDVARRARDATAMAAALARLQGAKNLDTSEAEGGRTRWIAGELDDVFVEAMDATLARAADVIGREKLDSRTRAAAHLLAASAQLRRAIMQGDAALAIQARAELVEARALWPALEINTWIIGAVLDEIGLGADRARWSEDRRIRSSVAVLHRWVAANDPLAAKVRASPRWTELVDIAKADVSRPGLDDWRLAELIGDATTIERTRSALADPLVRMRYEADAILDPGNESTAEDLALLTSR